MKIVTTNAKEGVFALSLVIFTSATAVARVAPPQPALPGGLAGKYAVEKNQCEIKDIRDLDRAVIRFSKNQDEQSEQGLSIVAYSDNYLDERFVHLGEGQRKRTQADGVVSWKAEIQNDELVSHYNFNRVGSDTWPDLNYSTITRIRQVPEAVIYTEETVYGQSIFKNSKESCLLSSLKNVPSEIKFESLSKASHVNLQKILDLSLNPKMDLDQAEIVRSAARISLSAPSDAQLREVLSVQLLPAFADEIRLSEVRAQHADEAAQKALSTVLRFASPKKAEYASLFALRDHLTQLVRQNDPSLLIRAVSFSASSVEGRGMLILDAKNGELVFVGGVYFE